MEIKNGGPDLCPVFRSVIIVISTNNRSQPVKKVQADANKKSEV